MARSLGAGSDKGETGLHLPPRLYRLCVLLVCFSCGSLVAFVVTYSRYWSLFVVSLVLLLFVLLSDVDCVLHI